MKYLLTIVCILAIVAAAYSQLFPQYPCTYRYCPVGFYCDMPQGQIACISCVTNASTIKFCFDIDV